MTTHAIHALTFDLSIDTKDSDSARYAQWIQTMLLPIIDEVVEQQAQQANIDKHHIARIQKLELDLGDISVEMSETEIGRRLRAQLSAALFEQLGINRHHKTRTIDDADEDKNELLEFLKLGHISWEKSGDSRYAHKKLVQEALNSPRFAEMFKELRQHPQQLLRLVRQFDHSDLFLLLRQSMRTWSSTETNLCLDWLSLELSLHAQDLPYLENLWLYVFHQNNAHHTRLRELSKGWYQLQGQDTARALLAYEATVNHAQTLTQLGQSSQQECKQTFERIRSHLLLESETADTDTHEQTNVSLNSKQITTALENADFASLGKQWSAILRYLPQTLRGLHPRHWQTWRHQLDTRQALELLAVLQPQCQWLFERMIDEIDNSPQEYQLLIEYSLAWGVDTLPARNLFELWEESTQSEPASVFLKQQLTAYAATSHFDLQASIDAELGSNLLVTNATSVDELYQGFIQIKTVEELRSMVRRMNAAQKSGLLATLKFSTLVDKLAALYPRSAIVLRELVLDWQLLATALETLQLAASKRFPPATSLSTELNFKNCLISVAALIHSSDTDAVEFIAALIEYATGQAHFKDLDLTAVIQQLDQITAPALKDTIKVVILEPAKFKSQQAVVLKPDSTERELRQAIIQYGMVECERMTSSFTPAQLLVYSSRLQPHLNELLEEIFKAQQTIAPILGANASQLMSVVWHTLLPQYQHFVSARQLLASVLQQTINDAERHEAIIAHLITATKLTSPLLMRTLISLQKTQQEPAIFLPLQRAEETLSAVEKFQNLNKADRIATAKQLTPQQKIAALEATQPALARLAHDVLLHGELLRDCLKSSFADIQISSEALQQGVVDTLLLADNIRLAETSSTSVFQTLVSALAEVTRLNAERIRNALSRHLQAALAEQMRRQWPSMYIAARAFSASKTARAVAAISDAESTPNTLQKQTPPNKPESNPLRLPRLLADFRDWQRGKISLQELSLELDELHQFLKWWLTHLSNLPEDAKQSFLDRALITCESAVSPVVFLESLLEALGSRVNTTISELDELLAWALSSQQETITSAQAPMRGPNGQARSELDFLLNEDLTSTMGNKIVPSDEVSQELASHANKSAGATRLEEILNTNAPWTQTKHGLRELLVDANTDELDIDELHRLLQIYGQQAMLDQEFAQAFLRSIERYALHASSPSHFLHHSLRQLFSDQELDLEAMLSNDHLQSKELNNDADPTRTSIDAVLALLDSLDLSYAPSEEHSIVEEKDKAWGLFLQQANVRGYLHLYLLEALRQIQSFDSPQLEWVDTLAGQKLANYIQQANATQLCGILSAIVRLEAQQQSAVLETCLVQHFGLPSALLTELLDDASSKQTWQQGVATLQHMWDNTRLAGQAHSATTLETIEHQFTSADSPLPKGWREALPQLLAEAFLTTNLNKLDVVWPELNRFHQAELQQAQKRYLHQANTRERLLQSESHEKLLDLISAFAPSLKKLLIDLRAACPSMVKVWKLQSNTEQVFNELLSKCYHLLFTTQLSRKTATQQLDQILRATSFWPQEAQAQQLYLRALYYRLENNDAPFLREKLGELCRQEDLMSLIAAPDSDRDHDAHETWDKENSDEGLISYESLAQSFIASVEETVSGSQAGAAWQILEAAVNSSMKTTFVLGLMDQASAVILSQLDATARAAIWSRLAVDLHQEQKSSDISDLRLRLAAHLVSVQTQYQQPSVETETSSAYEENIRAPKADLERLVIMLRSRAPLQHHEKRWMHIHFERIINKSRSAVSTLAQLLADENTLERLIDALDTVDLEFLFHRLHPQLHQHLHALSAAIEQTREWKLYQSNGFFSANAWSAFYRAAQCSSGGSGSGSPASALAFSREVLKILGQQLTQEIASVIPASAFTQQHLQDLLRYAREQKERDNRQRQAEEEAKQRALKTLKKKARLLGEEEEIPYGESNILNAGMVIIAPYIQRLFNILELTRDSAFVSNDAAERAVHILQYVVTAEQSTPEYRLALNKLLCGIHGGVPIIAGIDISDHERNVIEQMLNGVIAHWSALGKTSIAGLRQTFLAREGQLSFVDESWQLRIPSASFDMLLDRLPWSFAMIKFPWMRAPLHVTWRQ